MGGTKIQTAIVRGGKPIGQARLPTPRVGRRRCSRRSRERSPALQLRRGVKPDSLAGIGVGGTRATFTLPTNRIANS
jgi:hypothetical protein